MSIFQFASFDLKGINANTSKKKGYRIPALFWSGGKKKLYFTMGVNDNLNYHFYVDVVVNKKYHVAVAACSTLKHYMISLLYTAYIPTSEAN